MYICKKSEYKLLRKKEVDQKKKKKQLRLGNDLVKIL